MTGRCLLISPYSKEEKRDTLLSNNGWFSAHRVAPLLLWRRRLLGPVLVGTYNPVPVKLSTRNAHCTAFTLKLLTIRVTLYISITGITIYCYSTNSDIVFPLLQIYGTNSKI